MNIHSAIKFGSKNNIKVSPSHETTSDASAQVTDSKVDTPNTTNETPKSSTSTSGTSKNTKVQESTPRGTAKQEASTMTERSTQPEAKPSSHAEQAPKPAHKPMTAPSINAEPTFKAVDLSIAGTSHRITCPTDEVAQLEQAGSYINEKIREIRRHVKSKNPSNEELLVLVCLELYDQCQSLKNERKNHLLDNERAKALIEKITKDARSVL